MSPPKRPFLPVALERDRVTRLMDDWRNLTVAQPADDAATIQAALAEPGARALIEGIFSASPYVTGLLFAEIPSYRDYVALGPDAALKNIMTDLARPAGGDIKNLMAELRRAKQKAALIIALADMSAAWSVDQVTEALSAFADACVQRAVRSLLVQAAGRGAITHADPQHPDMECGYVVIGLGKLGGNELNYSSDIDLLVLFDERRVRYVGKTTAKEWAV